MVNDAHQILKWLPAMNGLNFITTYMTAWNSHKVEEIARLYHPNVKGTDIAEAHPLHGLADIRRMIDRFVGAFPDLRFIVADAVIEGDMLSLSWKIMGTHQGSFMNIPPSGRVIAVQGMTMLTMHDEQIIYSEQVWDLAGLLRDIGLLPKL